MLILAAPIQEFTDAAFRNAHAKAIGGITEYYAPFLRLEKGGIPRRAEKDLDPTNNCCSCLVPQILVKNAGETSFLLDWLEQLGYSRVDLNFGCPFPKVTRHGYGAGILLDKTAVKTVLQEVSVHSRLHVSIKMRLGMTSPEEAFDLLPILDGFPLQHIVLHPRTALQQYTGKTDMAAFFRFRDASRNHVLYNGDIISVTDAGDLDEVMLGRGLLANPLLPLQFAGETASDAQLISFHRQYIAECLRLYQQPLLKLQRLWEYFLPGISRKTRKTIQCARTLEEYQNSTDEFLGSLASGALPFISQASSNGNR